MKTLSIALMLSLAVNPAFAMGWKGSPDQQPTAVFDLPYDSAREVAFEGKVLLIAPAPCVALPVSSYHLHVLWKDETVEIHLAPCWYAAEQKPAFKVGDMISGIGSEASWKSGPLRVIMAREIRRGKDVLRLRDTEGKPLWR